MSLTLPDTMKHLILDYIDTVVDTGGTGYCEFQATTGTPLARLPLQAPPFAAADSGAMALDTTSVENTDATAGTIYKLVFYSTDDTARFTFSASTTTNANMVRVSSLTLGTGDDINITAMSLNMSSN